MKKFIDGSVFSINRMRSGRLCAELTSDVSWEEFSDYAYGFVECLSGSVVRKGDAVDV